MKKLVSIVLALAVIAAACSGFAAAYGFTAAELTEYPIVIVPGYSATEMYRVMDDGTTRHAWGINTDLILERVLANIVQLGKGLGDLTMGNAQYLAKVVGEEFKVMFEDMRCNPDGSSTYNLVRYKATAEETNTYNLKLEYPEGRFAHEPDIMGEISSYIGSKNIFNFTCDFRMGSEFCANQLDELITDIKEYTGKDKVNILAVSHGGQVTATYLALFGYKCDVANAVLTIPAIGGAGLAYDLLSETAKLDEEMLMRYIEHGMMWEDDYNWLLKAQQCGFLDNVIAQLIPYLREVVGYWGSLWDFIPTEYYEEVKKQLDPVESAALIAQSDRFHYEILANMSQSLQDCLDRGTKVSIVAGTGNNVVSGLQVNSDAIITVNASTGATCAPWGERFADGYTQINDCGGKYKVSPSLEVDASTAYLPDNTWFVNNYYHGMTYWDEYTKSLMMNLLLTEKITDVYSNPSFPQFRDTSNPSHAVYAEFDGAAPGYITGDSSKLIIKNICIENSVKILAVNIAGANLKANVIGTKALKPGSCLELELTGEIPQVSKKLVTVTVSYLMPGSVTPVNERVQAFTVMNGESAQYSGETVPAFTAQDNADSLFDRIALGGFSQAVKVFFNMLAKILYYWRTTLFA